MGLRSSIGRTPCGTSLVFSVSGPGELVGVDNGDPTDTTLYKGTSRKAFNGKALAIVRSTGSAGNITISVSASGLSSTPIVVGAHASPQIASSRARAASVWAKCPVTAAVADRGAISCLQAA